jgi:exopolysaccharide biosynthesis polyprenyl glycosylphosphotransferase
MPRAVAPYRSREIAVLGLVELLLSFAVLWTMIQAAGPSITPPATTDVLLRSAIGLAAVLTLLTGGFTLATGLFRVDVCLNRKGLLSVTGLTSITTLIVLLFVSQIPDNRLIPGRDLITPMMFAAWLVAIALVRLTFGFAMKRLSLTRRILLVGQPEQIRALNGRLHSPRGRIFYPVSIPGQSMTWTLLKAQKIWGVVVASRQAEADMEQLWDCKLRGLRIFSGPAFQEAYLGRIDLNEQGTGDLLTDEGYRAGRVSAVIKRLCDILIGGAMLVLTMPLMILTALAIKFDSPGPILYRQRRVGQFDKIFTLYKFRSMAVDAEAGGTPRWAQKQDPRITRVGRFIRMTRIDELPQLANVMLGEMSLVGPRPERPHFVAQLVRAIPHYSRRAYAKPGLTGWAQVNYPYGASIEDAREKLSYDLYYLKNRSIILDLIILVSTVRVVLLREGAR